MHPSQPSALVSEDVMEGQCEDGVRLCVCDVSHDALPLHCSAIPGIPVAVYGGVRYGTFPEQPHT